MWCGQNPPSHPHGKASFRALHAVQDETQEDESVVAVVNLHIFYNPLTHLSEVAGFWKLALVHKGCPRSDGQATPVEPFLGHTGRESFGEPEPAEEKRCSKDCSVAKAISSITDTGLYCTGERKCNNIYSNNRIAFMSTDEEPISSTEGSYFAMIPAPPVPVGWASSALKRSPALLSMSTWQFSPFGAPDTIYSPLNRTKGAAETHKQKNTL